MLPDKLLIGNQWRDASSGRRIELRDPSTGEVFHRVAEGAAEDIDAAVQAARAAFEDGLWLGMGHLQRERVMWKIAELIEANAEELAIMESRNLGLPVAFAHYMVAAAADAFRYYAGWCSKIHGATTDISQGAMKLLAYTLKEPVGVAGLIVPWNAPLLLACWKLGPALAAGCTCVLKPSEETPLSALRLGELMLDAGLPAGVVNVVPGYGATAGEALIHHPDVDKISFTGSTEVGRRIIHASTGNLKRVTLELGGKSPFIIFDDANLEAAIQAASAAIFTNSGQVCAAGSRLLVHDKVYDQVVAGLTAAAGLIKLGGGLEEGTQMGPLVSQKQMERVLGYIDSGRGEGARIVSGGVRHGELGYFVQPTVIADVKPSMKIAQEEIFGPVLAVSRFSDLEEALAQANDTVYGLASYVWTQDGGKAQEVSSRLRAGTVWVNTALITNYAVPCGGFKQSGWGREGGKEGVDAYLETKSVITQR